MRLGSGGNFVEQQLKPVLRTDAAEIRAMRTEFAKHRLIVRSHTLPNHSNSQPRDRRRFGWSDRAQAIRVRNRSLTPRIELVGGPKVCRQLLHKLSGCGWPIGMFELRGEAYFGESPKPFGDPLLR